MPAVLLGEVLKGFLDHRLVIALIDLAIDAPPERLAGFLVLLALAGCQRAPVDPAATLCAPHATLILPLVSFTQGNHSLNTQLLLRVSRTPRALGQYRPRGRCRQANDIGIVVQ